MDKLQIRILLLEDNDADVILLQAALLDLGLPDSQGLATFEAMHRSAPTLPIVVLSGVADEQLAIQAVQAGAQDYLLMLRSEFNPMIVNSPPGRGWGWVADGKTPRTWSPTPAPPRRGIVGDVA
ncbi:PAS/PAC sensor hybrid histidine kinase [Candidatus Moduliflexus flocculans]|uniref:PAS/PAC sensor hybrid histidine kinase n=1 Tax=Candidatus Moduliflexus flocculans TaxID=1499966 RepID=A0A081BRL6_9BACT|nr:PAS/PAC sensor hybrid histidine kinase [Candidatus Moduliflexus flocculans]